MQNPLTPVLLTDTSRLQEIYNLRVQAYENSPLSSTVNREIYPNGWSDELDERDTTRHWVLEDQGIIIAAARLAMLNNLNDTDGEFEGVPLPEQRPFAYWSRLVVHPDYRHKGIMKDLGIVRQNYLNIHPEIHFALSSVVQSRGESMLRKGFINLKDVVCDWNGVSGVYGLYFLPNSKTCKDWIKNRPSSHEKDQSEAQFL